MGFPLLNPLIHTTNSDVSSSTNAEPLQIGATLLWPRLGKTTFVLNGGQFEAKIRGPSNIVAWSFTLYREYRSYELSYNPPFYDVLTGQYVITVNVPADVECDLYDLQVLVSDGITLQTIEEANSVQVLDEYPSDFTIFHITDPHLEGRYDEHSRKLLWSLYQAQMYGADLVVITGDLTNGPFLSNTAFDIFKEMLRQSRVPMLVTPGNHDRDETGESYSMYLQNFGPDYYTANLGPEILIISSNTHHSPYKFNSTQLQWIEEDLAASTAQVKILIHHAPLYYVETDDYFLSDAEAAELLRITDTYDVDLVLTGHLHNDRVDMIDDTLWIITAPNGGAPWGIWQGIGHAQNAFRIIEFENYQPVSWNWEVDSTGRGLSQPWDKILIDRVPTNFRMQDTGGYLYIENTLNYSFNGIVVDFLVNPLNSPTQYIINNATLLEKIEGVDAWLLRLTLDLSAGESATITMYPDNAQAPVFNEIWSSDPGLVGSGMGFYANMSNEYGGIHWMQINISFNEGNYSVYNVGRISSVIFRYVGYFYENGSGDYQMFAFDYAGNNSTSPFYNFIVTERPTAPELNEIGAESTTGNFLVTWTSSTDPDGWVEYYELWMSNTSDFSVVLQEWTTTELEYNVTVTESDHFFFRVRARDNFNGPSHWSNVEDIIVKLPTIPVPPPLSPLLLVAGVIVVIVVVVGVLVYVFWRRKRQS